MRALAERDAQALALPVGAVMSRPLACVPADAFAYRAIGRMNRLKIRHLGVTDEDGAIVGALSARDLLRLRAEEAVSLGDEIDMAERLPELARAWAKLPQVTSALLAEGIPGADTAGIISRELGALTRQAAVIAEASMRQEGRGVPPCPYALVVLGSAGRGESMLALDQDNALVFAEGGAGRAGGSLVRGLGGSDRRHPQRGRGALLPRRRDGEESAVARVGLDMAAADRRLGHSVRPRRTCCRSTSSSTCGRCMATARWPIRCGGRAFDVTRGEIGFAKLLAEAAGTTEPGLNLLGGIRTGRAASTSRRRDCSASSRWRASSPSVITWWSGRRRPGLPA